MVVLALFIGSYTLGSSVTAFAQNTTSALVGRVLDPNSLPIKDAEVTVTHVESGSAQRTRTDIDGSFSMRGLRAGGPYRVVASKGGQTVSKSDVTLALAQTTDVELKFQTTAITETITVAASGLADRFARDSAGAVTQLDRRDLDAFASIQRNLQDYARIDPRVSQTDKERGEISVAGQNSRYNAITIDGVAINDPFGLEANNLPTLKQPISIDSIQSVQINVSNYDVTQKGYTGAGINAVTKSGTNQFKGSIYSVDRSDRLVGDRYNRALDIYTAPPAFSERTLGFTLGGPVVRDKLFFYVGYEELKSSRTAPDLGPIGSQSGGTVGVTSTAIAGAQAVARDRFAGFDIGVSPSGGGDLSVRDSLIKLDWTISESHRANLRFTRTEQLEPQFNGFQAATPTSLSLSSNWHNQKKAIDTTVVQWFADWSDVFSTEVKASKRDYESTPTVPIASPQVSLAFTGALPPGTPSAVIGGTRNLVFGTERSRHFNFLETGTTDVYLGGTYVAGAHEFKFGADHNRNTVRNGFLQDVYGNYTFRCENSSATYQYTFGTINCATATAAQIEAAVLENFSRGRPSIYTLQVPLSGNSLADAAGNMTQITTGAFAQDTFRVSPKLTLTVGMRYDVVSVSDAPRFNAAASAPMIAGNPITGARQTGGFGRSNSTVISDAGLWQPRFGFNYQFDTLRLTQLRGGFGLFQGAAANVWLINPYQNTGVTTRTVGCGGVFAACPSTNGLFSANPLSQPTNFAGAAPAASVDLLEEGLAQPSVWKANLGFEHQLPWLGMMVSAEVLVTKTKSSIYFQHLNLGASNRTGTDGRPLYYTAAGYNAACWTAGGVRITNTPQCGDFRSRALSNAAFNNVMMAARSTQGGGDVSTISVSRPVTRGIGFSLAYTYSRSKEVSPLTSSVAFSNFRSRAIFSPNEDVEANSAYLVRDRVNSTFTWQRQLIKGYRTTIGLFYEGRTGRPYSWTFANDANGDNTPANDLMYIPRAPGSGEVVFLGDTPTSRTNENLFWSIVDQNEGLSRNRGNVVKRNENFSPWTNSFDARISQELPAFFKGHKATFVVDILNFGNLLNKHWGRINEIAFASDGGQSRSFVNYVGLDAGGRYIYSVSNPTDFTTRQVRGESQWAVQTTIRYEF
jgi:hypothetical protein